MDNDPTEIFESRASNKVSRGLADDAWPGFRGDARRTGNTSAGGTAYYYELWNLNIGANYGSPVIMYDQIYITNSGGTRCYDLDGNLKWSYNSPNLYNTPLVHNGRVYVVDSGGNLNCFDANATGSGTTTRYWRYISVAGSSSSSPATDGTKIYYSTRHVSGVHAVWLSNGTLAWNSSMNGNATSECSPSYWNGRVYCGGGDQSGFGGSELFCFDASDGTELWNYSTGAGVVSSPAVEYGMVYVGSGDGYIYCFDAIGSGGKTTEKWRYNLNPTNSGILASPSVAYGKVFIGATGTTGRLYCLSAFGSGGSTTLFWNEPISTSTLYGICSSTAVTPKYVYVGTSNNAIQCRNITNGDEEWSQTFPFGGGLYGIGSSPAVYKDMIFFTSDNGILYALGKDRVPPKVVSSSPEDDEVDVAQDSVLSIQFDEDMDASTFNSATIVLEDSQANTITGTINYDSGQDKVTFTPDSLLPKNETYVLTVKTGVKDSHGNALDGNGNGLAEGPGVDEFTIQFSTPPFYKPAIADIPTLNPIEDVLLIKNLTTEITDPDTPFSELTIRLNSASPYVVLKGAELHMQYPNGVITDIINISVSDNAYTVYRDIDVFVIAKNDPPEIETIGTLVLTEDITYTLDISGNISDVDTQLSSLKMLVKSKEYSEEYFVVEGWNISFTYPEGILFDTIEITVYEGNINNEYKDIEQFVITVTPVNDPPELLEPEAQIKFLEDEMDDSILLDNWFFDPDDEDLDFNVTGNDKLSVRISTSSRVTLKAEADWHGQEELLFTATDDEFESISHLVKVVVESVNDPPEIVAILEPKDNLYIEYNQTIVLEAQVNDPDVAFGDQLAFLWYSDKDGELANTLRAENIKLSPGSHNLQFTVIDSDESYAAVNLRLFVNFPPGDDSDKDTDTTGDTDRTDSTDKNGSDLFVFIILTIVIIVIIVILIIFVLIKKKRSKKEEQTTPPAFITGYPGQLPMQFPGQSPGMQQNMYSMQLPQLQQQYSAAQYPEQSAATDYPGQFDQTPPQAVVPSAEYPELPAVSSGEQTIQGVSEVTNGVESGYEKTINPQQERISQDGEKPDNESKNSENSSGNNQEN